MKSIVILAIIALSSCTFLRDLATVTGTVTFAECITGAAGLTGVTITSATNIPTLTSGENIVAWFKKDTKTIKVDTCATDGTNAKLYKCTGTADISDETAKGNYTLEIKKDDGSAPTDTFTISGVKTLCYTGTCWTIASATSKTPEITIEDEEKGNFTITVNEDFETAPEVQVAGKKVTCTGDKAAKKITCTPKKEEVTKGEGLAVTIGECQLSTGVVLKANSSSFNKLSKIAIIALAFLLF